MRDFRFVRLSSINNISYDASLCKGPTSTGIVAIPGTRYRYVPPAVSKNWKDTDSISYIVGAAAGLCLKYWTPTD